MSEKRFGTNSKGIKRIEYHKKGVIVLDKTRLEFELKKLNKEELTKLFLKLKDVNLKLVERIELLEDQFDDLTDLDTLIKSIK